MLAAVDEIMLVQLDICSHFLTFTRLKIAIFSVLVTSQSYRINRFFKKPIHNDVVELVIKRVKCMLGYPESTRALVSPASLLYRFGPTSISLVPPSLTHVQMPGCCSDVIIVIGCRLDDWSMGRERSFSSYMDMVGIEPRTKTITANTWCVT